MKIESIRLKNYKAFEDVTINNLEPLSIFVGANGTGKTTLFSVFGFLSDALHHNVTMAIQRKGGYREIVSRGKIGEEIEIELKFRLEIAGRPRIVTYLLIINEENGKITITREVLRYKRAAYGSPFHFLDFSRGEGYAISNEEDFDKKDEDLHRDLQKLGSSDILAVKGLGQFEKFKAANAFRRYIEDWHSFDFHINDARATKEIEYAEHLADDGTNLASVAKFMFENHPQRFDDVLKKMEERVPGVTNVEATPTEDGRILLKFSDGSFKDPFISRFVSDGTIKMFAYLLLLHDPHPHPLLCVEEPENQLYPSLLIDLLEEFRDYTNRGGQIFISTHSPDLLNAAELKEVFWLTKQQGYTQILRATEDQHLTLLYQEGEPLGSLWKQGYFKGSNPQ